MATYIDKVAWITLKDRKVLFTRTKGNKVAYNPGGRREGQETDVQVLVREVLEETTARIRIETAEYLVTLEAPCHGKPAGTLLRTAYYTAEYEGDLVASSEVEELLWLDSKDGEKTTDMGRLILAWLKERDLID